MYFYLWNWSYINTEEVGTTKNPIIGNNESILKLLLKSELFLGEGLMKIRINRIVLRKRRSVCTYFTKRAVVLILFYFFNIKF